MLLSHGGGGAHSLPVGVNFNIVDKIYRICSLILRDFKYTVFGEEMTLFKEFFIVCVLSLVLGFVYLIYKKEL